MPTATQVKFIPVMAFKKGHKPWNFGTLKMVAGICKTCGKEFSKRNRNRITNFCSLTCSTKNLHRAEIILKRAITQKGAKRSDITRKKMSMSMMGKNMGKGELSHSYKGGKPYCKICNERLKSYGGSLCLEHTRLANTGEKNWRWIKDRTQLKKYLGSDERRSPAYKYWRKQVCDRDNWKCKINNGDCFGRSEVHHILGFTNHPELKYEVNNGITLCHFHHPKKRVEEIKLIQTFTGLVMQTN